MSNDADLIVCKVLGNLEIFRNLTAVWEMWGNFMDFTLYSA